MLESLGLDTVILSRLQFAYTIFIHFIFVPLTIGLAFIMAIMETIYVRTGKEIYKEMVKFWGLLFGINFAMGVATGIPMEFQFGTNWAYYSHYVGDVFGAPLALEGLMAFFLEATFIGLFFFGWDKLSKVKHCMVTWLVFLGSNLSGLWILIANGWMQNPVGSIFNYETMRMEVTSFSDLIFNPAAQTTFFHTITASYTLGAVFIIAISSFYLLKKRNIAFAKNSILIASVVGLFAVLLTAFSGDLKGVLLKEIQPVKLAVVEAIWDDEDAPAGFKIIALPNFADKKNNFEITIPYVLGLIMTHSTTEKLVGIKDLITENEQRIRSGLVAHNALKILKKDKHNDKANKEFQANVNNLGYSLLLKKFIPDISKATDTNIKAAAELTIPTVLPLFIAFRLMIGIGFFFILYFVIIIIKSYKDTIKDTRWLLITTLITLPLPWIAIYAGWFVTEYGRQPWVIQDILPTFLGASNIPASHVAFSLTGFIIIYSALVVVDFYLMIKYIKIGPDGSKNKNQAY